MSKEKTGGIPSSGGSTEHSLETNTLIVVLGASGDLAKKKVREPYYSTRTHARKRERDSRGGTAMTNGRPHRRRRRRAAAVACTPDAGGAPRSWKGTPSLNWLCPLLPPSPCPRLSTRRRLSQPCSTCTTMVSYQKESRLSVTLEPRWMNK